jgi:hypothetical protein
MIPDVITKLLFYKVGIMPAFRGVSSESQIIGLPRLGILSSHSKENKGILMSALLARLDRC